MKEELKTLVAPAHSAGNAIEQIKKLLAKLILVIEEKHAPENNRLDISNDVAGIRTLVAEISDKLGTLEDLDLKLEKVEAIHETVTEIRDHLLS